MRRSIAAVTVSASANLPCCASQRGDSGTWRRITHTINAEIAGTAATTRQPDMPNGAAGISSQLSKATNGKLVNWIAWFTVKARPRISLGTNSAM